MMKMRVKNAVLNWGTGGEVRVFDWAQGWPAVMFAQWVYLETPKRMLLCVLIRHTDLTPAATAFRVVIPREMISATGAVFA